MHGVTPKWPPVAFKCFAVEHRAIFDGTSPSIAKDWVGCSGECLGTSGLGPSLLYHHLTYFLCVILPIIFI